MSTYDIAGAFEAIENELINSMMRNFKRHRAEELVEGYNWSMWQADQLESLERYRVKNRKKFSRQFASLNKKIDEMLKTARSDGNASQEAEILQRIADGFKTFKKAPSASSGEFFRLNDRKLDSLIKATHSDLRKAEHAVLRRSNDVYRQAIFNAQVYANTGAGTYEKAVDMACRDFLNAGLQCVEYKNGSRHTLEEYARMAIRTANKRAYLMGEGEKRAEWGISTVVVNSRSGGCPLCAPYIGKVFIDDVYSGGKQSDGDYPLLSAAIRGGLFHPNCKDSTSTYYEGITTLKRVTEDELNDMKRIDTLEQQKKHYETRAKRLARVAKFSLDSDNRRTYAARAKANEEKAAAIAEKLPETEKNSEAETNTPIVSIDGVNVIDEYLKKANPGKGKIEYDDNYSVKRHKQEIRFAQWIFDNYGGDIRLLQESQEDGVKTADYLWNEKLWELKTRSNEKGADSAVREARKQIIENPGGLFINYGDNDISLEKVNESIKNRVKRYKTFVMDIFVINKGKVLEVLRYKK